MSPPTFKGNVKQLAAGGGSHEGRDPWAHGRRCSRRWNPIFGSTYVNQFTKFNNVFQVYVQADAPFRLQPGDVLKLKVKAADGQMVPLGAVASIKDEVGPPLITLYNLYPAATVIGGPAPASAPARP